MHAYVIKLIFIFSTNIYLLCTQYNEHYSVSALEEQTVLSLFLLSFITKSKWLNPSLILDTIFIEFMFLLCNFVSPLRWLIGPYLNH